MLHTYENEQLALVRESARQFAKDFIKPHIMDWDEKQFFPVELFKKNRTAGLYGNSCSRSI